MHGYESSPEDIRDTAQAVAWMSTNLDPARAVAHGRNIPGVLAYSTQAAQHGLNLGRPISARAIELIDHAYRNVHDVYESTGFFGVKSREDRLALVTDPETTVAISSLAYRRESEMLTAIGNYPGGRSILQLSPNGRHLVLQEYSRRSPDHYCPYAKSSHANSEPHPLMKHFAPWAGQVAVHITELYRRDK